MKLDFSLQHMHFCVVTEDSFVARRFWLDLDKFSIGFDKVRVYRQTFKQHFALYKKTKQVTTALIIAIRKFKMFSFKSRISIKLGSSN